MRDLLFWGGLFLALPACASFEASPTNPPGNNLVLGGVDAIFCDIEAARRCAEARDLQFGVSLFDAAIALNEGRTITIGLDYSAASTQKCGGNPEAVEFVGPYPDGQSYCVNCDATFPGRHPDPNGACRAACYDTYRVLSPDGTLRPQPSAEDKQRCDTTARASTNHPVNCFLGKCVEGGKQTLVPFFSSEDPRRMHELVSWTDMIGVTPDPAGTNLERTAETSNEWDAGAVSTQWITRGHAFVEFSAKRSQSQILGLAEVPSSCAPQTACPDGDASDDSIDYGILLRYDGAFFVYEDGVPVSGPGGLDGSFGPSNEGDRFRIYVRDKGDGTVTIEYSKLAVPCVPGRACQAPPFYTSQVPTRFPLRVDTSLFHKGATLTDVRLVRIK